MSLFTFRQDVSITYQHYSLLLLCEKPKLTCIFCCMRVRVRVRVRVCVRVHVRVRVCSLKSCCVLLGSCSGNELTDSLHPLSSSNLPSSGLHGFIPLSFTAPPLLLASSSPSTHYPLHLPPLLPSLLSNFKLFSWSCCSSISGIDPWEGRIGLCLVT